MIKENPKKGRPTIYTKELATSICNKIATGESLRKICKDEKMPARKTIHNWLLDKTKEDFLYQYEASCNVRADELFDELEETASDKKIDVQRARLIVDTRKWYLSKVLPKKFGDKMDITADVNITGCEISIRK